MSTKLHKMIKTVSSALLLPNFPFFFERDANFSKISVMDNSEAAVLCAAGAISASQRHLFLARRASPVHSGDSVCLAIANAAVNFLVSDGALKEIQIRIFLFSL